MSQALYRKYRSKSLADVVGQAHITDILSRALASGRIAHAYLLTGPRGVGKTSVARILAHEINNLPYSDDATNLDIIEIDAASNNGVEDVRDLREKVQLAPVQAAKKVYIIDEVHMLSKAAFNALLKTLEEPPAHVVFILATTDADKLPATIISRTQRFGFRAITTEDAVKHLKFIAKEEGITVSDEALALIAQRGDGSFRDSISLLDQLASLADDKDGITTKLIETSLGLAPTEAVSTLIDAAVKGDISTLIDTLDTMSANGISASVLNDQIVASLRGRVVATPQLLRLLDRLLDVNKSSHPDLKLLSVLGEYTSAATQQPQPAPASVKKAGPTKTIALASPVLEVTATIEELSKQATRKKPTEIAHETASTQDIAETTETPKTKKVKARAFDWETLVEYVKEHHVALYSVLSKCSHVLEESDLTLYAGNAFYKKKLDDPKYSAHLYESLESTGSYQLTIHTLPTPPPLKDSQAAAVAGIMGGGVEVSFDPS